MGSIVLCISLVQTPMITHLLLSQDEPSLQECRKASQADGHALSRSGFATGAPAFCHGLSFRETPCTPLEDKQTLLHVLHLAHLTYI